MDLVYPVCVVLLGYVVLGITGFGSALVIVPLLAWHWPLPEVVALTLLMDVPASLLHGGLNLRQVSFAELRRLLPGIAVGALAGLWLSSVLAATWPLLVLGLYVVMVGAQTLRVAPAKRPQLATPWAYAMGGAIGVVEMLFGTAGPLVVAGFSRRLSDVNVVRASTPVAIAASACAVLATMGWSGRLSHIDLWQRWLALIGVAVLGVMLGNRMAHSVPPLALRKVICGLLIVSGLTLVAHALN
ncbi:sulfite exporter TauE/SafE family protein [Comamonas thiooxydans]|uniref:sulfite exporter TauE/SafE family protein n=1 Tax=Comamonas thiooxydans TaxID=363952 RepID=UPI0020CCE43F|nr:sulfite exporter TauE/SafE family protein [Comamonas thiooxydans]BDR09721.1 sulfite exporter TauE/SafE family protein [Comamonas thiooxydans]